MDLHLKSNTTRGRKGDEACSHCLSPSAARDESLQAKNSFDRMTAQLLSAELTVLISESKRKHPDLRTAAEKSLSDVKSLPATSESQLSADLSRRPLFVEPFLLACASKNTKTASTGVSCLQRLAVSGGLPKGRLKDILDALRECGNLALEVQLRVLQALPPILQNYPADVRGELLFSLLQTCSILQSSKTVTVSSTAAATFQQVLSSLFEELKKEDSITIEIPTLAESEGLDGPVQVRPVAYDAVRVLQDLCLLVRGEKPVSIWFSPLPEASGLELVEAILANHSETITAHSELAHVLKLTLLPHLLASFKEKKSFAISVRVSRLLYMIVRNHNEVFPSETGLILDCFNSILDQNEGQAGWKRILCLEIYRGIFMEPKLILELYNLCDNKPSGKPIVKSCTASFVRLASEKPAIIGLSQQSTIPVGNYFQRETVDSSTESKPAALAAEGTAGVSTSAVPGISTQWSSVRAPFIDQLDKTDAPSLPETYAYSLVLLCLNNLADSLAKFVLPLTVQHSGKARKKHKQGSAEIMDNPPNEQNGSSLKRAPSTKKRNVPVNPLTLEAHSSYDDIQIVAALIDQCWPAILASCSTFFYASLDSEHYRALVKSFQKFAQVAGLLRMSTPRDAFLTTLGKAAVPAHVLAATFASPTIATTTTQSPSLLRSATGLLKVENLVNQASTLLPDRGRRMSLDSNETTLSSRNLLCLRALLNLAIALGPTLETSWSIVFETLQQADRIMAVVNLRPVSRAGLQSSIQSQTDTPQSHIIASEMSAIHAATSRLFESTSDYPNDSFIHVLRALCHFIDTHLADMDKLRSPPPTPGAQHKRISSFSLVSPHPKTAEKDYTFALSKLRELASTNVDRFVTFPPLESGWNILTSAVSCVATTFENSSTARLLGAELLSRLIRDIVSYVADAEPEKQDEMQSQALSTIASLCHDLESVQADSPSSYDDTAKDVHSIALDTLRAILEQTGETLASGWELVFNIISTVFTPSLVSQSNGREACAAHSSSLKSVPLGRSSFVAVQLICSDFLSSVPDNGLLTLIDTIYRFAAQNHDLNMSLTATTLFWNLSDLLYSRFSIKQLNEFCESTSSIRDTARPTQYVEPMPALQESLPALWTSLLCRVRDTATDGREEVRTGAITTLIRIFENHGHEMSEGVWHLYLNAILLPLMQTDADSFDAAISESTELKGRVTTSKLILEGNGKLLATYLHTISKCNQFETIWEKFVTSLEAYLSLRQYDVAEAVYRTVRNILSTIKSPEYLGAGPLESVTQMWVRNMPDSAIHSLSGSNQDAYQAYAISFREIYRLSADAISIDTIKEILENFGQMIERSDGSAYSSDIDSMTRLQKQILELLTLLRDDLDGTPALVLLLLARLASLPVDSRFDTGNIRQPTFIALAKAVMDKTLVYFEEHSDRVDIYDESILAILEALEKHISLKYTWKAQGKNPALWQKATTTLLAVIKPTIAQITGVALDDEHIYAYWDLIVRAGKSIAFANMTEASETAPIFDDEDFDTDAMTQFNNTIIPHLGASRIPDITRRAYARALFDNSLVHPAEDEEFPDLDKEPLRNLYNTRFGRTSRLEPSLRGSIAYHCLSHLIALVALHDSSPERVRLAQAAAPYLILRAALPLKTYIADQPLRGRYMPQQTSEREELLFVLRSVRELRSEPKSIPQSEGVHSETKRHLVRLHPLVVKAFAVAGKTASPDGQLLEELKGVLEAVGAEFRL